MAIHTRCVIDYIKLLWNQTFICQITFRNTKCIFHHPFLLSHSQKTLKRYNKHLLPALTCLLRKHATSFMNCFWWLLLSNIYVDNCNPHCKSAGNSSMRMCDLLSMLNCAIIDPLIPIAEQITVTIVHFRKETPYLIHTMHGDCSFDETH